MTDKVKIDQHLCLTEDGCCVVPETDPRARWLHWAPGNEVSKEEYDKLTARQCKCCKGVEPDFVAELPPPVAPKRRGRPPGSKNRTPQENK